MLELLGLAALFALSCFFGLKIVIRNLKLEKENRILQQKEILALKRIGTQKKTIQMLQNIIDSLRIQLCGK